jgi:hypothetical protein
MVQGLKQKGIATRKACEDYADSITETKIGAALIIGIARAEADLEIMEEENIKLRMVLPNHSLGLYH